MKVLRIGFVGHDGTTSWPFAAEAGDDLEWIVGVLEAALAGSDKNVIISCPGIVAMFRPTEISGYSIVDLDDKTYIANEVAYGIQRDAVNKAIEDGIESGKSKTGIGR